MSKINKISCQSLQDEINNGNVVVIDVREKVENKICSIQDSINISLKEINVKEITKLNTKNKKIVIHCKGGKRSMSACEKLKNEGINCEIWNLEGGIDEWKKNGFKTISNTKILPLERQVQITISTLILLGLTLNYFTSNNNYLLIPFIIGLGLLNAGITGWCGLAKFIAKMPWNK